jgi:hypothetical protein
MMPDGYECEIIWKDIISRNDWNLIKESLRFQEERKSNIRTSIQKEKQTNQVQISQINRSIQTMEMSLDILRSNKKLPDYGASFRKINFIWTYFRKNISSRRKYW